MFFVDFTYVTDLLNTRFERITRVFGYKTCTFRNDARPTTTSTNQRNTEHLCAFQHSNK